MKRSSTLWMGVVAGTALSASLAVAQPCDCGAWMDFDGIDDIVVSYADFNTEELTLETWVRVDSTHPLFASGLITWGTRDQGSYDFCIGPPSDRRLCFFINYANGTQQTMHGTTALNLREWYHVAVTYDGEVARVYVDGVLDGEAFFGNPIEPLSEGARLTIGDDWAGGSEFVHGGFDNVLVWNEARTGEQIADDMGGEMSPSDQSLMAFYTFDECKSNVVLDHSGSGRHAHLGASYDIGPDDPLSHLWAENVGRRRVMQVTSTLQGEVEPVPGSHEEVLDCINNCVTQSSWWLPIVNRHQDNHIRSAYECSDLLDRPYVDSETFLTGADEVTRHNCESAFYKFEFCLPPLFEDATLYGVMNGDDMAVVHLNGSAISPLIGPEDVGNFGTDRVDVWGHPVVGWPTADPVYTFDRDLFKTGMNELVFGVAGDISEFEPTGMEFIFNIRYDCLADWNADGDHNSIDFIEFLNDWSAMEGEADVNLDGKINTSDLLDWMNAWSYGCPE